MPVCGVTYENEAKVQEQFAAEEEKASIDSGEESPC
jgi:hypothetical protein